MIYAFENICQINVTTIVPIHCDDQLININMYMINLSLTSTHALSWIDLEHLCNNNSREIAASAEHWVRLSTFQ